MWSEVLAQLSYWISWAQVSLPFGIALLLGLLLPVLVVSLVTRPDVGAAAVALAFFVEVFFNLPVVPVGVTIYLTDLISLTLAAIGLWRLARGPWTGLERAWLLFSLAFFVSLALGLSKFGSAAGVEARYHFNFWAIATYFMRVTPSPLMWRRIVRTWALLIAALAVVCSYRWAALAFGFGDPLSWNESGTSLRVLKVDYAAAFMMSVPLFLWARRERHMGAWASVLAFIAFACAFVLQHRTAWVAGVVMALYLIGLSRRDALAAKKRTVLLYAAVAVLTIAAAVAAGGRVGESVTQSVQEVSAKESTWTWRTQSWRVLLEKWSREDVKTVLLGYPYGNGFDRYIEDSPIKLTQNPHNNYVYLILRVGLLGTLAFGVALFGVLFQLHRHSRDSGAALLAGMVVFQLAYFVPYPSAYGLAPFIGLALACARQQQVTSVAPRWMPRVAI